MFVIFRDISFLYVSVSVMLRITVGILEKREIVSYQIWNQAIEERSKTNRQKLLVNRIL